MVENNFQAVLQVLVVKIFRIFPEELGGWCFFLTSNLNSEKKKSVHRASDLEYSALPLMILIRD